MKQQEIILQQYFDMVQDVKCQKGAKSDKVSNIMDGNMK